MRIVNIIGGLGNQMFQYAFAIALKQRFPEEEVLVDTSHFNHLFIKEAKGYSLHNGYEIDKVFPNAKLMKASPWQMMKLTWYVPNYVLSRVARRILPKRKTEYIQARNDIFTFQEEALTRTGDCYYEGNWESSKFFIDCRAAVINAFAPGPANAENAHLISEMENTNSVALHVRRGDYIKSQKWSGICTEEYYRKAIAEILSDGERHIFYVFSNDLPWCEEKILQLLTKHRVVMMTHNKGKQSCWDMFLMTHCKDLIIANSSFSWWGAFLNTRNGRVVAPSKWLNEEREVDIWLDDWIKI